MPYLHPYSRPENAKSVNPRRDLALILAAGGVGQDPVHAFTRRAQDQIRSYRTFMFQGRKDGSFISYSESERPST
jgi:hypothetical protein